MADGQNRDESRPFGSDSENKSGQNVVTTPPQPRGSSERPPAPPKGSGNAN